MSLENIDQPELVKLPNTWDVIDRIGSTLQLFDRELSDMLQLTDRELEKFRSTKKDLPMTKVFALSERLNLGFSSIVTGKIDYQALSQHYFGKMDYLPERYTNASLSKRRVPACILNYVESMFGWKERLQILKHFQLNEAIFANLDSNINFLFTSDICEYLYRYKLGESALSQIGLQSFLSTNPTEVKRELTDCRSVADLYLKMSEEIVPKYFEQNFIYKMVSMEPTKCTISAKPNPDLEEMLKQKNIGNPATALLRTGVAAAYTTILGLSPAKVKQTSCIYKGDPEISYEIDFSLPHSEFEAQQDEDRIPTFCN